MINGDLKKRISERAIDGIPEGWILTTIAEIAELNPPKPSQNALPPHTPVTFVPMPAVDAESGVISRPETRQFSEVRKGYTAFLEGDVIMAKITPCMENGKAAVVRDLENRLGFGSTEFHVLRSNGSVLPGYVYYFIRQQSFRKAAEAEMTGSVGQKRVPGEFLKQAEIQLPPFAEQKRIVTKIEKLLARVNFTKERLAKVSMILKRFRQAVLAAACSGRLTADWRENATRVTPVDQTIHEILQQREEEWIKANTSKKYKRPQDVRIDGLQALPKGWKYISSDTLISFVTSGSRGWAKYYAESGPIFIRVGNLDHYTISPNFTGVQHVNPPAGQERDRTRTQLGDILISITADVGMIALLQDEIGEAYVNQHVSIARPVKNTFRPYLAWYLASREGGQAQFQDLQRGATKVGLGLDDIKLVAIPFPPIEEQHEIVRRVETLFKLADAIEKKVAAANLRVEKLTQAILSKAFRGELVPTEAELARRERRSYESASELLARIKSARDSKRSPESVNRIRGPRKRMK